MLNFESYYEFIIIGICLCVGYILKNIVPSERVNRFIPLVMGLLGAVLSVWTADLAFTPEIIFSGLISGLASTGMYEAFSQFISRGE